jgi:hypothetical protein
MIFYLALDAETMSVGLSIPIPALEPVNPWLPKLNALATNEDGDKVHAFQAIVKKEVTVGSTTRMRGRSMKEVDRRKLEDSIPSDAHRGLRMLCVDDLLDLAIDCPVDTTAGEFACAKLSNVYLNVAKIRELVQPILEKLVNDEESGAFDQIGVPLLQLEKRIPGISDVAGKTITILDIAGKKRQWLHCAIGNCSSHIRLLMQIHTLDRNPGHLLQETSLTCTKQ